MKIICYGDSNTYGYDPRLGSSGRLAKNERWTGILDSESDLEIANEGMCGRCIPSSTAEFNSLKKILRQHSDADMLIIMLGSNDLFMTRNATAEIIADKMQNMLVNVPELTRWKSQSAVELEDPAPASGKRILLVCPPAPSDRAIFFEMIGIPVSQTAERAARIMKELPEKLAAVAAAYGLEFADATKWNISCLFDGLHFSEEGHKALAKHILTIIRNP